MPAVLDRRLVVEKVQNWCSPMEIVCLDYLSPERLVITDHFSWYAQVIPMLNQMAKPTARVLFDNFIVHNSFLEKNSQWPKSKLWVSYH